jgi:hypothetical protein
MDLQKRWFTGFALAAALALWSGVSSTAEPESWNSGQTLTVEPKMNIIPNTDIYYQRRAPGYDFYRYANRWYVVDSGLWYGADSWRGPFARLEIADLPEDLTVLPEAYRKHWDAEVRQAWASQRTITKKPKMTAITDSNVTYASQYSDFDLYRYRGSWYLMDDGIWYRSDSWKGPFMSTRADLVPKAVRNVPTTYRRHWTIPTSG